MKKTLVIILLLLGILLFDQKQETKEEELRGVYISYIEISKYLKGKEEETSKNNINQMIENIKSMNLNTIILQVRPSTDAIYHSKIFPLSKYLTDTNEYPYDVLSYFTQICHENNIKLYAWINPYRISTTGTIQDIKENSPAYSYIGSDVLYENNGVYWNPARKETNEIILKGIEEVLEYDVDGILFDDYFYPGEDVDKLEYISSKKTKEEFRLSIINEMVKEVHNLCKSKNVLFGISPEGNIENNYQKNYADIFTWLKEEDYIDFIMPQLYYGFFNSTKPFVTTSNEWNNYIQNNIPLYPVLAMYKVGKEDFYAKEGKNEWIENNNIIAKEIIHIRNLSHYKGFVLYRYDNLFLEEDFTNNSQIEIQNLKNLVK